MWKENVIAFITLILMIVVDYQVGVFLVNAVSTISDPTLKMVSFIAMTVVMMIGTFGVPLIIAQGKLINPLSGIVGMGMFLFMLPVCIVFITTLETVANALLTGTLLFIVQFVMIMLVLIFMFIAPIFVMLEGVGKIANVKTLS